MISERGFFPCKLSSILKSLNDRFKSIDRRVSRVAPGFFNVDDFDFPETDQLPEFNLRQFVTLAEVKKAISHPFPQF